MAKGKQNSDANFVNVRVIGVVTVENHRYKK